MSEGRLQRKLASEPGTQSGLLFESLCQGVESGQGEGLQYGLCRSRILGLHSLYIHKFSITDVQGL